MVTDVFTDLMLYGESVNNLDSKSRIFLPMKWRESLTERIVLHVGFGNDAGGHYLQMLPYESFKKFVVEINKIATSDTRFEAMKRHIFRNTEEVAPDKQGRIIIPKRLLEHARIEGEVLMNGAGSCIELWNPDLFNESIADYNQKEFAGDMARFTEYCEKHES